MKKVLYVVGAGLAVGAVAATFYWLNNRKKKVSKETCEYKNFDDKLEAKKAESSNDEIIAQDVLMYENVRSSAIGSMCSRHESAASVMRDSIDAISENINVSENTNDEIDEISVELDKMIGED